MSNAVFAPDWLCARPIAHRGLHDRASGVVENSPSAARAAVAANYAIECDVQISRDGQAVVFHDFSLERLTEASGEVSTRALVDLQALTLKGSADAIVSLRQFLVVVDGAVPLVIEIKSAFDGDLRLTRAVLADIAEYQGPIALKSFDPEPIAYARAQNVRRPLGVVAQSDFAGDEWRALSPAKRDELTRFGHADRTRPDFLSWRLVDLPAPVTSFARAMLNMKVLTWTVRSQEQQDQARRFADQIVFEQFRPLQHDVF